MHTSQKQHQSLAFMTQLALYAKNTVKPYFKVCPYRCFTSLYLAFRLPEICTIRLNTKATSSAKIQKHKYYNQIETNQNPPLSRILQRYRAKFPFITIA